MTIITTNPLLFNSNLPPNSSEVAISTDTTSLTVIIDSLYTILEQDNDRNHLQVYSLTNIPPRTLINNLASLFLFYYSQSIYYVHVESYKDQRWQLLDRLQPVQKETINGRTHRYVKIDPDRITSSFPFYYI